MLTSEQYNKIAPHKEALLLFKRSGQWIGGSEIYEVHKSIFGEHINMNCNTCKAKAVGECLIAMELYERNM